MLSNHGMTDVVCVFLSQYKSNAILLMYVKWSLPIYVCVIVEM